MSEAPPFGQIIGSVFSAMYGCENDLSPQQVMRVGINLNDVAERFTGRRTGCNNSVHKPQIVRLLHAMPRWNDKPNAQPTTAS